MACGEVVCMVGCNINRRNTSMLSRYGCDLDLGTLKESLDDTYFIYRDMGLQHRVGLGLGLRAQHKES